MLEFYWTYADYTDLMPLTEQLLVDIAHKAMGTDEIQYGGQTISLKAPFRRLSMREAARDAASRRLGTPIDAGRSAFARRGGCARSQAECWSGCGHGGREDHRGDFRGALRG